MKLPTQILAMSFLFSVHSEAAAEQVTSTYTKIQLDTCLLQEDPFAQDEGTFGGSWFCNGYTGIPVYVAEGDLRMFVSFGANAMNEPAAGQTLPNFNTINETLEWRLRGGTPFTTILRWFPDKGENGKTGSILIVTQLVPGATCQVARADAQANKDANVMARQAANLLAGNFECDQSPVVLGAPGMLGK